MNRENEKEDRFLSYISDREEEKDKASFVQRE